MFNVAIVEDEAEAREKLEHFLARYEHETGENFNITCYQDPLAFLDQDRQKYDIVLMDILMPHLNGLDAARIFRERDHNAVLLFVTSTIQFAVNGYEVDALDYVVKPINYESFFRKIERAVICAHKNEDREIVISRADGLIRISHRFIRYLTVRDHLVYFYTDEGIYDFWCPLVGTAPILHLTLREF